MIIEAEASTSKAGKVYDEESGNELAGGSDTSSLCDSEETLSESDSLNDFVVSDTLPLTQEVDEEGEEAGDDEGEQGVKRTPFPSPPSEQDEVASSEVDLDRADELLKSLGRRLEEAECIIGFARAAIAEHITSSRKRGYPPSEERAEDILKGRRVRRLVRKSRVVQDEEEEEWYHGLTVTTPITLAEEEQGDSTKQEEEVY